MLWHESIQPPRPAGTQSNAVHNTPHLVSLSAACLRGPSAAPCASRTCFMHHVAARMGAADSFARCQIIKRPSNLWSFIALLLLLLLSPSLSLVQLSCACRRGPWLRIRARETQGAISVSTARSGTLLSSLDARSRTPGRGASRKDDRSPPTASLADPAAAQDFPRSGVVRDGCVA